MTLATLRQRQTDSLLWLDQSRHRRFRHGPWPARVPDGPRVPDSSPSRCCRIFASIALPLVRTYTQVVLYGCAMGISGGVVTVVFFSVWGQAFGRSHLGRIQGCAQMLTVFASAVGPLLLAETLRQTGSYNLIFQVLAVTVVLLGIACWFVAVPSREVRSPSARLCDPISEPSA